MEESGRPGGPSPGQEPEPGSRARRKAKFWNLKSRRLECNSWASQCQKLSQRGRSEEAKRRKTTSSKKAPASNEEWCWSSGIRRKSLRFTSTQLHAWNVLSPALAHYFTVFRYDSSSIFFEFFFKETSVKPCLNLSSPSINFQPDLSSNASRRQPTAHYPPLYIHSKLKMKTAPGAESGELSDK